MLEVKCQEHFAEVLKTAIKIGKIDSLRDKLNYLNKYACYTDEGNGLDLAKTRCELHKDFAPLSFQFCMFQKNEKTGEYVYWFTGGLIFHGSIDSFGSGSSPTFAVTLTPCDGWSIHT